jgi:hypothetical protein
MPRAPGATFTPDSFHSRFALPTGRPSRNWARTVVRVQSSDRAALHPGTLGDLSLLFAVLGDVLLHDLS